MILQNNTVPFHMPENPRNERIYYLVVHIDRANFRNRLSSFLFYLFSIQSSNRSTKEIQNLKVYLNFEKKLETM